MTETETRYFDCESCGLIFKAERVGIALTHKCPNCNQDADAISYQEYIKLLEQKELI